MKALTVRQPWATLLTIGAKRIETRSWNTRHEGPLLIHAGKAMPCRIGQRLQLGEWEVERDQSGLLLRGPRFAWPYRLPVGAVIGMVDIIYTRSTSSGEYGPGPEEMPLGDHSPGRYGWYTDSLSERFQRPIPCAGKLGLWDFPDELLPEVWLREAQRREAEYAEVRS